MYVCGGLIVGGFFGALFAPACPVWGTVIPVCGMAIGTILGILVERRTRPANSGTPPRGDGTRDS